MKTLSSLLLALYVAVGISAMACAAPSEVSKADELGWAFEYDDANRVTKITDPAGRDTRFDYNFFDENLRERVKIAADGSLVVHEFDKDERLVRMKDGAGEVSYGYDYQGWLNRVERKGEPAISYDRDSQGRIVRMQVGDFKLEYRYDFLGRLSSINTPAGPIEYDYFTGQGKVERKYPNGIRTFIHYKPNRELRGITHGYFANPTAMSFQIVAMYSYQYRPDGLIDKIVEQSEYGQSTKTYDYDQDRRLVKADSSEGRRFVYEYDLLGNRLKAASPNAPPQLSEVDWAGRLTRIGGELAIHDAAGNLTAAVMVDGEKLNYHYTTDNQLAEVNGNVSYRYDGEGRLIARKARNVETRFIPDPLSLYWQPLVIETKGGSRTLVVWEGATPLLLIKDGKPQFLLHDHLGSVRLVADGKGRIIQRFDYEPFGTFLNPEAATEFAPRFAGLFWDSEAKAYLTLARAYKPDLARFIGVEPQRRIPWGSQKDLSVYTYCGNDPVNFVDRDGTEAVSINHSEVWWNAFWKDISGHLFDARRAKDTLANYSEAHLGEARGSGVAAGLTATALDIIGGYIPGEGGNRGQAYASVGWSLALGGFNSGGNVATALRSVGYTRTTSSAIINSYQGNYVSALLDTVYLGGSALSARADNLMSGSYSLTNRQYEFNFVNKTLMDSAKRLDLTSKGIDVFGYYSSVYDTYKAGCKDHVSVKREELGRTISSGFEIEDSPQHAVNILISGRGINQYEDPSKIETGYVDLFGKFKPGLFTYEKHAVYMLPPKHENEKGYNKTEDQVAKEVYTLLKRHLAPSGTLKPGQSFELRTAHDVNSKNYLFGGEPQDRARDSTVGVLLGVDKFKKEFGSAQDPPIAVGVQAGSNDGMTYTYAINEMTKTNQRPVDFLFLDDPQVKNSELEKVIHSLGNENVAIFIPSLGLGDPIRGEGEIASYGPNAKKLAHQYPRFRVYSYQARDGFIPGFSAHVQASISPREKDQIRLYNSNNSRWETPRESTFGSYIDNQFEQINTANKVSADNAQNRRGPSVVNIDERWDRKRKKNDEVYDYIKKFIFFGLPPPPGGSAAFSPSTVGGVNLSGAGKTLDGMGNLKGIQVDENNNLMLIAGSENEEIKIPPLRLDDLVTVFRSVYLHGGGPTVTINPAARNPQKSAMYIKHGEGTENTYVGWILYQADRLMKGYNLGVDNKTQKNIESKIAGYQDILNTIYFGGEFEKRQKGGFWERFWIVPDEARRFDGPRQKLTIFDIPLRVDTQSMKWKDGELVDDLTRQSSVGAKAFTEWFGANYDGIAKEQYLTPPKESGISEPVPVFFELRRIALITAIAEKLRDQGVPMPFWMRDYEMQEVPFENTTPAMEITRSNGKVGSRIFGGVNLSPVSKEVKIFNVSSDLSKVPQEKRIEVDRSVKLAGSLEKTIATLESLATALPLTRKTFKHQSEKFQVVSIQGAETQALGSCRLQEADMVVPLPNGQAISLVRNYNSFFNPFDLWGRGWTLNLPRLEEIKMPVERQRSSVQYKIALELISPLNTVYARFSDVRPIPELGGSKLMVPDRKGRFYGLAEEQSDFLSNPTRVLQLKDGQKWYFTSYGNLVAVEDKGMRTVYERNNEGRINRIVGLLGMKIAGEIVLEYTTDGLLSRVTGRSFSTPKTSEMALSYQYNKTLRLESVTSDSGTVGYQYSGPWISAVTWKDQGANSSEDAVELYSFKFNGQGQMVSEKRGDEVTQYEIVKSLKGLAITSNVVGSPTDQESFRYDGQLRPVESISSDGTRTEWRYAKNGETEISVTTTQQEKIEVTISVDGKRRIVRSDRRDEIVFTYDDAGRMVEVAKDGQTLLRQEWLPTGQLARIETEMQAVSYQYDKSGVLSSEKLNPPDEKNQFKHWQETKFDSLGRPVSVKDHTGSDVALSYDDSGTLASMVQKTPDGNYGYQVERDDRGRLEAVKSSWGKQQFRYDKQGMLEWAKVVLGNAHSTAEWKAGRLVKVRQFGGGETRLSYSNSGNINQITTPNGLTLDYRHDPQGRLQKVSFGDTMDLNLTYDKSGRLSRWAYHAKEESSRQQETKEAMIATVLPRAETPEEEKRPVVTSPLEARRQDAIRAAVSLGNATVVDLYVDEKGKPYLTITDSLGNVEAPDDTVAKNFLKMLSTTESVKGKFGEKLLGAWNAFFREHLAGSIKKRQWTMPDGRTVILKPLLLIRSSEVNFKYTNLEKVPALADNFVTFIASKTVASGELSETTAEELSKKIESIPAISKEKIVFAISPPKTGLTREMQKDWERVVSRLENMVGERNVLFNPSKDEFTGMLGDRSREVIVIELTHTEDVIKLRGDDEYSSLDFNKLDLSHIKYLISGIGTCSLPRLENGELVAALRRSGVGIVNTSYRPVSNQTVIRRIEELIHILESTERFNLPAYYLVDIIDQLIGIQGADTTNIGKLELIVPYEEVSSTT